MTLKERIDGDIKNAMLARKKEELEALRGIKSMILLAQTDKSSGGIINEEIENKLLMKAAKQRRESAEIFQRENRNDLAEKELFQLEVISRYLPTALDNDTLEAGLKSLIAELGATEPAQMGKVMGAATKKFAGQADGKVISEMVKKLLGS